MSEQAQDARSPEKSGALHEVVEIIKTVVYALGIALVLRVLLFQPFTIPSASMVPNLLEGDYVVVSKYSYGWSRHSIPFSPPLFEGRVFAHEPHRGDIIVFKLPRDGKTDYVKRLIGLPGDRIVVRGGVVYLNGSPIPRKPLPPAMIDAGFGYARPVDQYLETLPEGKSFVVNDFGPDNDLDNTSEFVVPEGHYFFMGDNRDNSSDSRVPPAEGGVGYVPAVNLEGKAQMVLLSWDKDASLFKPWTWFTHARPGRFFKPVQ
ncbi:signal peptidase I [Phenylobacterium sp.]|jgi:signal peptidase I|uniref:signal peptidase I n=1 Tax=Phenylobacterium sp. TaxID=1871053 RepID=UPI002F41A588